MRKVFLMILALLYTPLMSQELPEAPPQDTVVEEAVVVQTNRLPDVLTLRIDFMTTIPKSDDIYRLAGIYLAYKIYGKAAELYGQFITENTAPKTQQASAYYNRALALFAIRDYYGAKKEFQNAYAYNNKLHDTLRMLGTIYFITKQKEQTISYWEQYLAANTTPSPERTSIENMLQKINDPEFTYFDIEEEEEIIPDNTWPFGTPDSLPYPDAQYPKKRII